MSPIRRLIPMVICLIVSSCGGGGGGGGGGSAGSAPSISNLQYSPSSAFGGTGPALVMGSAQFSAPQGNLASFHLTTSAGATQSVSLAAAAGLTSGTIQGAFQIDTSQLGNYTFDVWVVDSGGNVSNHLSGTFDVVLGDLAQSWTARSTNTTPQLNKVIWAGNRFVAVGDSGLIVTSPDGNTWTAQVSGTQAVLTDVTWTGSQYVAVGNIAASGAVVLTSPDAVTWTVPTASFPGTPLAGLDLTGVAYSGTNLVAVGYNMGDNTGRIFTSTDAVNWTAVSPNPAAQLDTVIWTGSQFVAGGVASSGPAVLHSPDGAAWTTDAITGSGGISALVSAASGATLLGVGGAVWINPSGAGWQATSNAANIPSFPLAVGWSGHHYLVCNTTACALSANGQQWSAAAAPPAGTQSLVWGGPGIGRWIAVGFAGQIASSP